MISFGYRPDVEVDGDDIVNVGNESNSVDRYLCRVSCYYRSYYSIMVCRCLNIITVDILIYSILFLWWR